MSLSTMSNSAAWLLSKGAKLVVSTAPMPVPNEYDVIIRARAIAINPFDSLVQRAEADVISKFPKILGHDVAGVVVALGAKVTLVRVGDRVLASGDGCLNQPKYGCFQEFVTASHLKVSKIPETLGFIDASVIPLGITTAAVGLFRRDMLALDFPTGPKVALDAALGAPELHHPTFAAKSPKEQALIVWGAASSVGSNAVQLASSAGYRVFATASPKNVDIVRGLGAQAVFDYRSPTVKEDMVEAIGDTQVAGAFCAVAGVLDVVADILRETQGRNFVASAPYVPEEYTSDIETKWVNIQLGEKSEEVDRVVQMVFQKFLPDALKTNYKIFPPPRVFGSGLEIIQEALDVQHNGLSAQKLVVEL